VQQVDRVESSVFLLCAIIIALIFNPDNAMCVVSICAVISLMLLLNIDGVNLFY